MPNSKSKNMKTISITKAKIRPLPIAASIAVATILSYFAIDKYFVLKNTIMRQQREIEALSLVLSDSSTDELFPACKDSVKTIIEALKYCGPPSKIFLHHEYVTYMSYLEPCNDGVVAKYNEFELIFSCKGELEKAREWQRNIGWKYSSTNKK